MKFASKAAAISLLVLLAVTACSPASPAVVTDQPTPPAEESTEAPSGKIAADALPCDQGVEGMQLYADEAYGICALIPDGFTISHPDAHEIAAFVASAPVDGNTPLGWIMVDDAGGKTAAEFAATAVAEAEALGLKPTQSTITLGGEEAVVVDGLSGQDVTRKVFVVHGGTRYEIAFAPSDPDLAAYAALETLYNSVIDTFAFMR